VDLETELAPILDYIDDLEKQGQFYQRHQSQGRQTENFDILEQKKLFPLFQNVDPLIDLISNKWGIQKKLRLINFWVNIDKKHDYSISHYHIEGIISGIFYVKIPNNTSRVIFERPDLQEHYFEGDTVNEYNYKNYSYTAEENRLILFPSYLKHRVEQNLTEDIDDRRISISFNYGL
jgi:uncharacterized protein (TIGR02466 family)